MQQQVESAVGVAGYLDNSASRVLVQGRELYMQVELACVLGRAFCRHHKTGKLVGLA